MENSINIGEFVNILRGQYPHKSKDECREMLDAVIGNMGDILANGVEINFAGFGTFNINEVKGRIGRHPVTGEAMPIDGYKHITFKASSKIKERLK